MMKFALRVAPKTRGRGLPLTGFAVRMATHLRERFEAVYEGSFFTAGIVGPNRNGEPCRSAIGNEGSR